MKQKIWSMTLCLFLMVGLIFTLPQSASAATEGIYEYSVSDGKATITNCDETTSGALIIPDTLGGYPVAAIGENAFYDCVSLTTITIPDGVTAIGDSAFYYCESLTNIEVDAQNNYYSSLNGNLYNKGKTTLIQYAIGKTDTSFAIPDSVTTIGENAFTYCTGLTSVTIPDSVTTIGDYAFSGCKSLTTITIPDGVTTIGEGAFFGCESLTTITMPDSVTTIGERAFCDCESLTNIEVDAQNNYYSSLNGNLYNKDKTTLIQYAIGKTDTSFAIPDSVTTIGESAFNLCRSLTTITIPDGVTTIGDYAFGWCTGLTSVTIPDSVTTIGYGAFYCCTGLTSVTIPDSVITIGERAFFNCESLTSVTIPNSVTTIGDDAFGWCDSLTDIKVDAQNNYYSSLNGNLYNKDKTTLVWYACGKTDTSFAIPDSVTTIGNYASSCCSSLTTITMPDSVTTIGEYAFSECKSLTTITIPDGVTTIGNGAFFGCESLTTITMPDSVTTIGEYAFSSCYSLTSVTIGSSVTTIGDNAFHWCASLTDVYYTGTEYQWNAIEIASFNDHLLRATIHFNASDTQPPQLRVMLNNQEISFDVPPQIVDGRTVVPLRAIFEALGATVTWDASTRTILAEKAGTKVQLTVDEKTMYVNGKAVELDVAAMIVDGRTLVPVRAISESFDCSVAWDGNTRTVSITK